MTGKLMKSEPKFHRGDLVVVHEPGIPDYTGVVGAVKWSPVSGWYVDVRRDDDGITWILAEHLVEARS